MAGFSKLFSTIWGGSLYGHFEASAVFMVFLSLCDHNGVVDMTHEAIAGTTGWPLDFIKAGIRELEAEDARSRTPAAQGKRILRIDEHREWGWSITNYAKYRDQMRSVERREYLAEAKRKERSRKNVNQSQPSSTSDNRCRPITDTEAEADTEATTTLSGKQPDGVDIDAIHKTNGRNYKIEAIEVLEFLNTKTGRKYRPVDPTIKPIMARLKTCSVQDMKTVIARKHREWNTNEKMEKYLRPKTLFAAANFENYLGECVLPK